MQENYIVPKLKKPKSKKIKADVPVLQVKGTAKPVKQPRHRNVFQPVSHKIGV